MVFISELGLLSNTFSNFTPPRRNSLIEGQGFPITEASRSRSDTPHSVGLLRTSDLPVTKISTWQHTTRTRKRYPCSGGIRTPPVTASERPQTHALDCAATVIRFQLLRLCFIEYQVSSWITNWKECSRTRQWHNLDSVKAFACKDQVISIKKVLPFCCTAAYS